MEFDFIGGGSVVADFNEENQRRDGGQGPEKDSGRHRERVDSE